MQEIVLLLSSLAGIATAAAVRATSTTYRGKSKVLTLGASSHIQSQIKTLRLEKQILASTITRLYQSEEFDITRERKEKMLARYQHQMGIVMARLEKMEDAKKHPDLGPVGDGLITLMDQKMSGLDAKMHNITMAVADIKAGQEKQQQHTESKDASIGASSAQVAKTADTSWFGKAAGAKDAAPDGATIPRTVRPFEITTLTSIPLRKPSPPTLEGAEKRKPEVKVAPAPTVAPQEQPVVAPTVAPTVAPQEQPVVAPTVAPTVAPQEQPVVAPTVAPTVAPQEQPVVVPTVAPTVAPQEQPVVAPTVAPTVAPQEQPVVAPKPKGVVITPETGEIVQPVVPTPQVGIKKPAQKGPEHIPEKPKPPRPDEGQKKLISETPIPDAGIGGTGTAQDAGLSPSGQVPQTGTTEPLAEGALQPQKRGAGGTDDNKGEKDGEGEGEGEGDDEEIKRLLKDVARTIAKLDRAESE